MTPSVTRPKTCLGGQDRIPFRNLVLSKKRERHMARLVGVDLPREKRMAIALTYIYGIGRSQAVKALEATGISPDLRSKDLSDDPRARETGGIMPMLTRKDMAPEIETVAFTIATNKLSDIITSQTGFHIIKVQELLPSRKIPFEEVDAKLMENLSVMEAQKQLPDFLAKLKKELNVEILDPKFDTGK